MIKLQNIAIENGIARSNIFPEDSEVGGNIAVDVLKNEIIKFALPDGYEWCRKHIEHAKEYLIRLGNSEEPIPKEKTLMWC